MSDLIEFKHCRICDTDKPPNEFHKNGDTYHPDCGPCRQMDRKSENNARKEGTKYCPGCGVEHPTNHFDSDKISPDGLQSNCKKIRTQLRIQRKSTKDGYIKIFLGDLRRNTKRDGTEMSIEFQDISDLFDKQNGLCAISGMEMTNIANKKSIDGLSFHKWNLRIDKIDTEKGYINGNIRLICAVINRLETPLKGNDFLILPTAIAEYNRNDISEIISSEITGLIPSLTKPKSNSLMIETIDNFRSHVPSGGYPKEMQKYIPYLLKGNKYGNITSKDILDLYLKQNKRCALTGKYMTCNTFQAYKPEVNKWNIAIDKIDSSKEYTKDNIKLICNIVGQMKIHLNEIELLKFCNGVHKNNFDEITKLIPNLLKNSHRTLTGNDLKK